MSPRGFLLSISRISLLAVVGFATALCGLAAAQSVRVEGKVRDPNGGAVGGAEVELRAGPTSGKRICDSSGGFVFESVAQTSGTVSVRAPGFAVAEKNWNVTDGLSVHLEIVLSIAPSSERVMVTAARIETRLSDVAGSAVALTPEDVDSTPALLTDDKLRQIPGFMLFRRSDSRTANPTSQGVSLNGLGASGSSRALVLEDGIPLNDPFGGWIYWGRVPQQALASVEVVRGGVSSLYGSNALGGVIQFVSHPAEEKSAMSLETSYGSEQTPDLSFWAGSRVGQWDGTVATDLFRTDGFVQVPVAQRGTVDTAANAEHASVEATAGRHFKKHDRVFARGTFFREARNNGTPVQTNDTTFGQGAAGVDTQLGAVGSLAVRAYGSVQAYNQNFSSVAANRNSESLTNIQYVPAQQTGGSVLWSRALGSMQNLVAGVDGSEVMGWSHERTFSSGAQTATSVSGGRQRTVGVFGEDIFRFTPKWIVTLGARFDDWQNFDASTRRVPVGTGAITSTNFPDRAQNAFSPRLSVLRGLTSNVSLTASIYRAFRSPTLNELYRSFRLGNTLTQANAALNAERLTGAEAGVTAFAFRRKLNLRGNFFWDDIVDPLANVPISTTPSLITQQRENLGRTRSRGVDLDSVFRLNDDLQISGGYQFVDATVVHASAYASLVGLRIPEVPRHQFTLQARYWNPSRLMLSVQGRFSSSQFDDALNTLLLDRYFTVDAQAGRSVGHGVEVFAAVENLLNQRYDTSLTPVANRPLLPTLSAPFLARVGIRLDYPSRR
jgi:outer membrane receptor protein involved in Fe transport